MAEGILLGGNLAVLAGLFDTVRYHQPDTVLLSRISRNLVYKMERILYQLRLSGVLGRLRGLVVTSSRIINLTRIIRGMEGMIRDVADYDFPVAFNADRACVSQYSADKSARVTLKVNAEGVE